MPTVASLNNSLCEEAHPTILGDAAIVASLENAAGQSILSSDVVNNPFTDAVQPGLWYAVRGVDQDKPGIAQKQAVASIFMFLPIVIIRLATFPSLFIEAPSPIQSRGR
jgi:hypothetical protein